MSKGTRARKHPTKWLFPSDQALADMERQVRISGNLAKNPATLLIKAVRSQRRVIEKLVAEKYAAEAAKDW